MTDKRDNASEHADRSDGASMRRRLPCLAVVACLAAVLLAACGGSSKPSGAESSVPSRQAFTAMAYKYPACMRQHGVTNFPDPQVNGNHLTLQINPSITGSPAFDSARKACAYLLPDQGRQLNDGGPTQQTARIEGLLAFAACVRQHGFPSFPDPNSQGQLTPEMITQAGINLHQPAVLQAGDACASASHGLITKSDVAQAVANPSATGTPSSAGG
jgi:hypothetical protein